VRKRYSAVLFDLDGTLLDFRACEASALRGALASAGLAFDGRLDGERFWQVYAPLKSFYWRERGAGRLTREEAIARAIGQTLSALGLDPALAPAISSSYMVLFARAREVQPGAREVLEALAGRARLALVTNGYSDAQRGRLEAAGLGSYFPVVLVSEEVGCEKPDPRIFALALSRLGVGPEAALHVGDSIEHDYRGARAAGIDFCHYDPAGLRPVLDPEPAMRIARLAELIEKLT
jgi:HAD superfamily hydrolase (TIGR01549 family)